MCKRSIEAQHLRKTLQQYISLFHLKNNELLITAIITPQQESVHHVNKTSKTNLFQWSTIFDSEILRDWSKKSWCNDINHHSYELCKRAIRRMGKIIVPIKVWMKNDASKQWNSNSETIQMIGVPILRNFIQWFVDYIDDIIYHFWNARQNARSYEDLFSRVFQQFEVRKQFAAKNHP